MCGIAGILAFSSQPTNLADMTRKMANAMWHRGPDDGDSWTDEMARISLSHRRLSILDLSLAGHQPMHSSCGKYVIVFNGEIYNHLKLRILLKNEHKVDKWRGHSDTETILACIVAWGVEKTLKSLVGMFAFALWDRQNRTLVLARDRLGEKPLYFGTVNGLFVFASELKAVCTLPEFKRKINCDALALFMQYNYVPDPYCIYDNFKKLLPGTWIEAHISSGDLVVSDPRSYWSAIETALSGKDNPLFFKSDIELIDALDNQLRQSVGLQMLADVPLGAFLSGGIDSSLVLSLMQAQSSQPVKTFAIGFQENDYNEAPYAKAVANYLGTEHTELYVTVEDALKVVPHLPIIYDEPFADPSQIPTYLVSHMARKQVKVILSGDGGDELFGGYTRYFFAEKLWKILAHVPKTLRKVIIATIYSLPPTKWDRIYQHIVPILPQKYRFQLLGDKIYKAARSLLNSRTQADLYLNLISHWDPAKIVLGITEPVSLFSQPLPILKTFFEQMMLLDSITYLPGDILTKVDRAAMSLSLETRVPLLEHQLFEFVWRLPLHYKIRNGTSKWLLKQVLYKYVPKNLVDRPKMGFGVPIGSWLRGSLREWAEDLLDISCLREEGYFQPELIRQKWDEHLTGRHNWQYPLWNVLMFQSWLRGSK